MDGPNFEVAAQKRRNLKIYSKYFMKGYILQKLRIDGSAGFFNCLSCRCILICKINSTSSFA